MPPPARRSAQAQQARGLGGDAVSCHQLLLLANGAEEAERVRAEADQPDRPERNQAERRAGCDRQPLAPAAGAEQQERQQQRRRDLDAHARHQRGRGGGRARGGSGTERQRGRQQQQQQGVVVCAGHGQRQQHRVQAHERGREAARVAQAPRGPRNQRDRREAAGHGKRLERPQSAGEPQRCGEIAGQREQRAVRGVLEGPADEREHRIARGFRGDVRIRIEPVQRSQAGEAEVAEDVLRDQGRAEQQRQVSGDDRRDHRAQRQRARSEQHEQVAGAHDQHQRLVAARAEAHPQALQRPCQPARPATAATGHIRRGPRRGRGGEHQRCRNHAHEPGGTDRAQDVRRALRRDPAGGRRRLGAVPRAAARAHARNGARSLHRPIVASRPPAGVCGAR